MAFSYECIYIPPLLAASKECVGLGSIGGTACFIIVLYKEPKRGMTSLRKPPRHNRSMNTRRHRGLMST